MLSNRLTRSVKRWRQVEELTLRDRPTVRPPHAVPQAREDCHTCSASCASRLAHLVIKLTYQGWATRDNAVRTGCEVNTSKIVLRLDFYIIKSIYCPGRVQETTAMDIKDLCLI